MKKQLFLLSVGAALLAHGEKVDEYQWLASATEGNFDDPGNWAKEEGAAFGYPQAGCLSYFYNIGGNWTVKIPASMGDDASYTLVRNLKDGSRLVFDATETIWHKIRPADTPWYDNKIFVIESGGNLPLLGINADTSEKGRHGLSFGGLMTFDVAKTGSTLTFAEGSVFNVREFNGENSELNPQHTAQLFRDNSTTYNKIVFEPNTMSHWYQLNFDCRSDWGFNTFRIEGGEHRVDKDLTVKMNIGQLSTGIVEMVSGTLAVANNIYLNRLAEIRLAGDSAMSFGGQLFLPYLDGSADMRPQMTVEVADTANFTGRTVNHRGKFSDALFRLRDQASISFGDTVNIAQNSDQTAQVELSGQSVMSIWNFNCGKGQNAQVAVDLSENAQLTIGRENNWYGGADSRISFVVRDQAVFKENNLYYYWNIGATNIETAVIDVNLMGGSVDIQPRGINFTVSPASRVRFAGTEVTTADLTVKRTIDATTAYRPDVALTDGSITLSGTATLDALDATGGRLIAKTITGGTDADILFDGTVVSPYADNQVLMSGIATAKVGATGLVLDPAGKTTTLDQAFVDAEENTGRVSIQGTGTVKVLQASTHTTTELAGGTLALETGVNAFGQNLVFAGGTFDLSATTGDFICKTLSVGDARGTVAFPMPEDGTYQIFTVTEGVELDDLKRIRIANRQLGRAYTWTVTATELGTLCSVVRGDPLELSVEEDTTFDASMDWGDSVSIDVADGAAAVVTGVVLGDDTLISKTGAGSLTVSGENELTGASWVVDGGRVNVTSAESLGSSVGVMLKDGTFEYAGTTAARIEGPLTMAAAANKHPVILKTTGDLTFTSAAATHGELVKTGVGTLTFDVGEGSWNLGVAVPTNPDERLRGEGAITLPPSGASPTEAEFGNLRGVSILEGTLEIQGVGTNKSIVSTQNESIIGAHYAGAAPAKLKVENARFNFGSGSHPSVFCWDLPKGAPAPSIELTNAFLWADSCRIGGDSTSEVVRPEIRMTDSTFYNHYNSNIGSGNVRPIIVANNSKLYSPAPVQWTVWGLTSAEFSGAEAMLGSTDVTTDNNDGAGRIRFLNAGGIKDASMTFSDGARLVVSRGLWYLNDNNGTTMQPTVFDGGIFEVLAHKSGKEYYSQMGQTYQQCFQAGEKGLTIRIAEETSHVITFPIRGVGKFTKDGAGTLKMLESRQVNWGGHDQSEIVDRPLIENAGGLDVAEGTLVLNGGLVNVLPDVRVAEGATLDLANTNQLAVATIAGGGMVKNGTLTGPIVRQPASETVEPSLTFDNVALAADQEIRIDFSTLAAVDTKEHTIEVATLAANCRVGAEGLEVSGWRAVGINVPLKEGRKDRRRLSATFHRDAETGRVTVDYKVSMGTLITIR